MVKDRNSILTGWNAVTVSLAVIFCGLIAPAYCITEDPVLLLQQTPTQGGTIKPDTGVHHFNLNTDVNLTAVPKPGYQFVYWLGDVSDPTANRTVVHLDAPKIVIAVFERAEYAFAIETLYSIPGGLWGGMFPSASDYGRVGFGGGGGVSSELIPRPRPPETEQPDLPVPEEETDFPVPIPEPATGILLVVGSLLAFLRHRKKD